MAGQTIISGSQPALRHALLPEGTPSTPFEPFPVRPPPRTLAPLRARRKHKTLFLFYPLTPFSGPLFLFCPHLGLGKITDKNYRGCDNLWAVIFCNKKHTHLIDSKNNSPSKKSHVRYLSDHIPSLTGGE